MPKDNKPPIFEVLEQVKTLKRDTEVIKNDLLIIKDYIKNKEKKSKEKEEARKGWFY